MLQTQTVSEATLALIKRLMLDKHLQDFYLVGGTALALQLGHRKSIDIDLFTGTDFDALKMRDYLVDEHKAEVSYIGTNTFLGYINDIKVDLIAHKYPLINPVGSVDGIRMVSLNDIAAMKFNAIVQDGSRLKDFVDVSCLLQHFSLQSMLDAYEKKYEEASGKIAKKALLYYNDIDFTVPIAYMKKHQQKWDEIKKQLEKAVQFPDQSIPYTK
ncbi:MAG: nucleotidyl transferase AbiEii/AbiGii toxin family protein [Cryomorphaceae bacterium]|nr:nucleotidyl transferase AbiEii/AbiGii toxin family protein [Cryomorphaceae bacterium]